MIVHCVEAEKSHERTAIFNANQVFKIIHPLLWSPLYIPAIKRNLCIGWQYAEADKNLEIRVHTASLGDTVGIVLCSLAI